MNLFHKYFFLLSGVASVSLLTNFATYETPAYATPTSGKNQQRQGPNVVSPSSNGEQMKSRGMRDVDIQQRSGTAEEIEPLPELGRVRERARLEQQVTKEQLQQVQQRLSERLNTPLTADGLMGPNTRTALRQYQKDNNLLVTGRPDPETLESLGIKK
ncbi:MAG: peptidoglycan-binding domain-containing protein [Bdellovibrionota bacterium]|jgi:hypothetical protein